jgi:hypothetical protein
MRMLAAAALAAVTALRAAAAEPTVQPLPQNARALANDVASKATAEERAWADEAGHRRPLPSYDALKAEVRSKFASHRRMSDLEIGRLAYLGFVKGFDDGSAEYARRTAVLHVPTPTPPPSYRTQPGGSVKQAQGGVSQGADLAMINIQSLVSQRQEAMQLTAQMMGAMEGTSRTIAANVGR